MGWEEEISGVRDGGELERKWECHVKNGIGRDEGRGMATKSCAFAVFLISGDEAMG